MRANPVRLTPLTPEESVFAESNYGVLRWCVEILQINEDYSGEAALGYLQAVKKWFARPDLHQLSFATVAKWTVRARVGNAKKKKNCARFRPSPWMMPSREPTA